MKHILAPFVRSAQGDNRNGDPQWRQWDAVSPCGESSKIAEFAVPLKVGGLWGLLLRFTISAGDSFGLDIPRCHQCKGSVVIGACM